MRFHLISNIYYLTQQHESNSQHPQNGKIITDLNAYAMDFRLEHGIHILRVDNLRGNPRYVAGAVKKK